MAPNRAFRAADDVQVGPEDPGAQDRIHVLGIRPHRRDEPPGPVDTGSLQHLFPAGVRLDDEYPALDGGRRSDRVVLDHDEGHCLAPEFERHDAADAAVAAHDEVILDRLEHAELSSTAQPLGQAACHHGRRKQRERVEGRPDASHQQHDREQLTGTRRSCTSRYPTVVTVMTVM